MKGNPKILHDQYTEIQYHQFKQSSTLKKLIKIAGWLSLPLVYPLVWITKLAPEIAFRTISEFLSIFPFTIGVIVRYEFYKRTLRSCGENVFTSFGTIFYYPDISIGSNVLIGLYNTIHHCDFGDHVMTAEGCRFLSGSKYHNFERTDMPMSKQGGLMKRIRVGNDVWIGANAVIMDDVGDGSIVGAGSVVNSKIDPYSVVAGNPGKIIRKRIFCTFLALYTIKSVYKFYIFISCTPALNSNINDLFLKVYYLQELNGLYF